MLKFKGNVLIPLLASNFDYAMELLYQVSVNGVAEGFYLFERKYCDLSGKNLKEIFKGLSLKTLRKLEFSSMSLQNVFEVLFCVQRYDVSLLDQLEKINANVMELFNDTIYRKENGERPLFDYESISKNRFLDIIKEFA